MRRGFLGAPKPAAPAAKPSGRVADLRARLAEAERRLRAAREKRLRAETAFDRAPSAPPAPADALVSDLAALGGPALEALASHADPPPEPLFRLAEAVALLLQARALVDLGDHPLPGRVPWKNLQVLLRKPRAAEASMRAAAAALSRRPFGARLLRYARERLCGGDAPVERWQVEAADARCAGLFDAASRVVAEEAPAAQAPPLAAELSPEQQAERERLGAEVAAAEEEVARLRRQAREAERSAAAAAEFARANAPPAAAAPALSKEEVARLQKEVKDAERAEARAEEARAAAAAAKPAEPAVQEVSDRPHGGPQAAEGAVSPDTAQPAAGARDAAAAAKPAEPAVQEVSDQPPGGPQAAEGAVSLGTAGPAAAASEPAAATPAAVVTSRQTLQYCLGETAVPLLQETVLASLSGAVMEPRARGSRALEVIGHAEDREEPGTALQRAEAVREWMVGPGGVDPERLRVSAAPPGGRGDRRVELALLDSSGVDLAEVRRKADGMLASLLAREAAAPSEAAAAAGACVGERMQAAAAEAQAGPASAGAAAAAGCEAAAPPEATVEQIASGEGGRRGLRVVFRGPSLAASPADASLDVGPRAVRLSSASGAWPSVEAALPFAVEGAGEGAARFSKRAGTLTLQLRALEAS